MTSSPSSGPAHQRHDRLLIAALAAGDAAGAERDRALAQIEACDSCRDLMSDLQAITRAVASVPTISRPIGSDFQLAVRDAHRLARGGWWRRALRPFGSTRGSILGPAAATMMTLGLAGLILSAGSILQIGAAGSAPAGVAFGPNQTLSEPAPASSGGTGGIADRLGASGVPMTIPSSVPGSTPPSLNAGLPGSPAPSVAAGPTVSAAPAAAAGPTDAGPIVAAGPTKTAPPPVAADATKGSTEGVHSPAPAGDRGLLAMVSGLLLIAGVGVLLLRRVAVRSP